MDTDADMDSFTVEERRQKMVASAAKLRPKYELYAKKVELKPGDIVYWKEGLSNRRFPRPNTVAIVTRCLPQPIVDPKKKDAGSPYFNEPLDLVLGTFDSDGDFVEFHFDGSRFDLADVDSCKGIHVGVSCDVCNSSEFTGNRNKCTVCENYDLCDACQAAGRTSLKHETGHPMKIIPAPTVAHLKECFEALSVQEAFKAGDLVEWKPCLKNKRRPDMGELAVVIEVLPSPIFDSAKKGASIAYFREPLDIKLGLLDPDGDLTVYHFDSRRFQKAVL